ncbi:MAG: SCO1664 family protein [Chloroflexota bacterium]|jgi:hypothetical protein|nr:SCO1664 family protein [Chloroflexota bacterium]
MQKEHILLALRDGEIKLEGRFIYGSNYTFMASVLYGGQVLPAVYKPLEGERPLWDFPAQTLAHREVAAYLVSEALRWDLVPPTVLRNSEAPMGPGSLQIFVEHDPEYHYFTFGEAEKQVMGKVMLFDLLINNADRKGGHLLINPSGELKLIDHGLCFHVEDKLRTVVWDHAGEPIPEDLLADVDKALRLLSKGKPLYQGLKPQLSQEEISALRERGQALVQSGLFPRPPEDRRAYPWPLV